MITICKIGFNNHEKKIQIQYIMLKVLRIWDVYPGSGFSIPDPPQLLLEKEFEYSWPKKLMLNTRKYDPRCLSRIRIFSIRIPGSKSTGSRIQISNTG